MENTNIPNKLPEKKQLINTKEIFIKSTLLALTLAVVALTVTFIAIANHKLSIFANSAGIEKKNIIQTLKTGWQQTPTETQGYKNLLILGVDTLETRGDSTPLTDSIMIASINLKTGKIIILPLPRDLWNEAYQTKINALYTYGLDRYPENPQKFPQEIISEMIDLKIHHTLIVSMETVAEVIDLMGGVEINVKQGFVDKKFPRIDVDVITETDPRKLYEIVKFETGKQLMDGQKALKYIRSRHGDNDQNTDNARSYRQQDVIQALTSKFLSQSSLFNTSLMGQLYRYYLDNFAQDLPPTELIAVGKTLLLIKNAILLENKAISIYPDDPTGTIEHPPQYLYDNQWVYIIRDKTKFKLDIQNQLIK